MKKKVAIMSISENSNIYYKDVLYDLFGDAIEISLYSKSKEGFSAMAKADLYLVCATSSDVFDYALSCIPQDAAVVISNVTFTKKCLDLVKKIPKGTKALLVNLSHNMALESVSELYRLGVNNVELTPIGPDSAEMPYQEIALTPAETGFVPSFVKEIIDVGERTFTGRTVVEMAFKLGIPQFFDSDKCKEYMANLADQEYGLDSLNAYSLKFESRFENLLDVLEVGIIGIDVDNKIFAFNSAAEDITGEKKESVMNKTTDEALAFMPINLYKDQMVNVQTRLITVKNTPISLNITPILQKDRFMGYFAVIQRFSDEEKRQHSLRLQLLDKGHAAKYTFDDIVGSSHQLLKAKSIAKKMSASNASILLTGESGTGKELFAHAIHKSSPRCDMPFVAINCAALPDTLLESELFGYGDGSFTGAKKGGKLGLFEHAHRGTLFLDEIEGMSPNLQVKLLRVLQEKEVMRVGEDRIISIDVRIIAASNEDIKGMVQKGTFRKDLYYRLNTLPIDIPPLRERGEDILLIMEHIKKQIDAKFSLTQEAKEAFLTYIWDGNIRELRNIIEYLSYMDKELIGIDELPDNLKESGEHHPFRADATREIDFIAQLKAVSGTRFNLYKFVLNQLSLAERSGVFLGRKSLSENAKSMGISLSEQEVRTILLSLAGLKLITIEKGRNGTKISENGKKVIKQI